MQRESAAGVPVSEPTPRQEVGVGSRRAGRDESCDVMLFGYEYVMGW
jgi:hypothetical protein